MNQYHLTERFYCSLPENIVPIELSKQFSNKAEKENFRRFQTVIANAFIEEHCFFYSFRVTVVEKVSCPHNSMELTNNIFQRLLRDIQNKGFEVDEKLDGNSRVVTVFFPEKDCLERFGFSDDEWNHKFWAPSLRETIIDGIKKLYAVKISDIVSVLHKDPDLDQYEFVVGGGPQPTVFKWIEEDFQKRGFATSLTDKKLTIINQLRSNVVEDVTDAKPSSIESLPSAEGFEKTSYEESKEFVP